MRRDRWKAHSAGTQAGLLLVLASLSQIAAAQTPPRSGCLHYEPTIVELKGRAIIEKHYGPPNFGEDTATDQRVEVGMFVLDKPIAICGDTAADSLNAESFAHVVKLQLVFSQLGPVDYPSFMNQDLVFTGSLYEGQTAHYYTDVAITVYAVRFADGRVVEFQRSSEMRTSVSVSPGSAASKDPVYTAAIVEEQPELLSAPRLIYPPLLRDAGIQGEVIVRGILDTLGRVDPQSLRSSRLPIPASTNQRSISC